MKNSIPLSLTAIMLATSLCLAGRANATNYDLPLELVTTFDGATVKLYSLSNTNVAGQLFSVTRLDFLLSDFALRQDNGTWVERTNWQAYVSLGEDRTRAQVKDLPEGGYDRVRFHVGLRKDLNHSDPAQYAPNHPLNANLNGLHWGWAGGYVFFAWEGRWQTSDGVSKGYSFHLGSDSMLMTVEVPVRVVIGRDPSLRLVLEMKRLFEGQPLLQFTDDNTSTHSRDKDVFAARLRTQVESAFRVARGGPATEVAQRDDGRPKPIIAPGATPYRFKFARQFPPPPLPRDNPLSNEGVELGRRLFNESCLSVNGKQSCASCHQAEAMFTDAGKAFSVGAEGQAGTRNAMPLFNLAWKRSFFWDGRAPTLRDQVLMPIQNPVEMHESLTNVVTRLAASEEYPGLFERAFAGHEITADRVARALEQFLLTLVSYDSKFDRAMQGREQLTAEESYGFELFNTEYDPRRGFFGADCFHCHGGPFFTNHGFANNGLDAEPRDRGLAEVTGRDWDEGRFSVPSLRNVAITGPYMHDGRFATLEEVIEHYATGVKRTATLDPNLAKHPDGGVPLSAADRKALVAFLKTLTDRQYAPVESLTSAAAPAQKHR